jgi:prepilin-type N-terminal cleavage/methylation domain-containing protein
MMIALNKKGYSLIEMLIVIALIGVLLSIAIPSWMRYRQNADLRTAARGIAGDFFNMKQRAVGEAVNYRITFDQENNRYQMINTSTADTTTRNLSEFGPGIIITHVAFGDDAIDFYTRGTAEAGHIDLQNGIGSTATITVNITGRTYVSFTMQ